MTRPFPLQTCAPRIRVTCQKCGKSRDYSARLGQDEAIKRFAKEHGDFAHHYFPNLDDAWRQFVLFREAYDIDRELKKLTEEAVTPGESRPSFLRYDGERRH